MGRPLHIVSVNQDSGIDPARKKGAAVHLRAMRQAFAQLGATVTAIDENDLDRLRQRLRRAVGPDRPDLVYERYVLGRSAAAVFARDNDIPYVVEVNAPLADEQRRWRGQAESEDDRREDAVTFAAAGFVAAVSRQVASYAVARGAPAETVFVCPNGIDTRLFRPGVEPAQPLVAALPSGAFVLGFHGRERPWHGFQLLAEAAGVLLDRNFPVHLLVIGEGDFSALSGLPETSFTRLPWVAHEQIPSLIGRFDALPLTYPPETPCYFSPLKLAEAMACGAVPVVPDLGDLASAVVHGHNGLVYPAGDRHALVKSLASLIENPSLKSALADAAARSAHEQGWDRIARRILDHFDLSPADGIINAS
jgi:glycosyltransferase involved in cell wall biosynthesis